MAADAVRESGPLTEHDTRFAVRRSIPAAMPILLIEAGGQLAGHLLALLVADRIVHLSRTELDIRDAANADDWAKRIRPDCIVDVNPGTTNAVRREFAIVPFINDLRRNRLISGQTLNLTRRFGKRCATLWKFWQISEDLRICFSEQKFMQVTCFIIDRTH
jgi:hypothetical protein